MLTPTDTFDRDAKLDGLGVAFFAVVGALLDAMAEAHPDGVEAVRRVRVVSAEMVAAVTERVGGLEGAAVRSEALGAIASVFAGTCAGGEAGSADERDEVGPAAA